MKIKVFILSVILVCCLLPGISLAQKKVVVIPLMEESTAQTPYPCTGPDEVMSNGRCWKDRNLGASRVATSSTDTYAYGDIYQWGRLGDGHQNRTSSITFVSSDYDVPGHGDFIKGPQFNWDWRWQHNDILWQGLGGVNNPCPQGFRVPTETEWETEMNSWSTQDATGAFASPLKLVLAGYRAYGTGALTAVGIYGGYWSSTIDGILALILSLNGSLGPTYRGGGFSVRCLKD